jgi:hypothetical protein
MAAAECNRTWSEQLPESNGGTNQAQKTRQRMLRELQS